MNIELDISTLLTSIGISLATAAWLGRVLVNQLFNKELEKTKSEFAQKLVAFKACHEAEIRKEVEVFLKQNEASIHYESEAKARLYSAIGPLKFQLLLAARDFTVRVRGLSRQPHEMNVKGHYGKSTIYRIARLFCLTELIERQVTYADFSVDSSAVRLLQFKKALFLLFSGSKITYHHPKSVWESQEEHLFFDVISSIGNALVVESGMPSARCMSFSEFSDELSNPAFATNIEPLVHILEGFEINKSPILWLRMVCVAVLCSNIIEELGAPIGFDKKPLDFMSLLRKTDDEYINNKIQKYAVHLQETLDEGL
ncbi:hypothetical protein [Pseudoalteromonas ardens]|uniref:Uncharacterized protein n=1 Tax=Pseudoalteromonas rubra TaxID=43658 RepID=A0A0L0EPL7_9GAMM|nr:hypothetical protein [Pseudoalteromonas sp. R96]KNC66320.1 hypothetical protein AC626_17675 [Pseudoalteromonas rubra]MDK1312800.1 hypothetical protein [Pseudoalteromonas sp. R96]